MTDSSSNYDKALGIGGGALTYYGVKKFGTRQICNLISKGLEDVSPEENQILSNAVTDVFNKSGLKEKGVTLHNVENASDEDIIKIIFNKANEIITNNEKKKSRINKRITFEKLNLEDLNVPKEFQRLIKATIEGRNALYIPFTKQIMINTKELSWAAFHELGHAMNHNINKLTKYLALSRYGFVGLAPIFVGIGLFKNKKKDGEHPKGTFDKITTFIKDNCGKLAFLSMVPTMAEEGLASINGGKLAKKVLSADLYKKVCKSNAIAWCTYLVGATMIGLGANLAVRIRDKIAQPKSES